ncbi:MAG: hypothetical protein AVDCRST_MAG05-4373, partial [uncultured Rubrobacteraceae bacterium]
AGDRFHPREHRRQGPGGVRPVLQGLFRHGGGSLAGLLGPGPLAAGRQPAAPPLQGRRSGARQVPLRPRRGRLRGGVQGGAGEGRPGGVRRLLHRQGAAGRRGADVHKRPGGEPRRDQRPRRLGARRGRDRGDPQDRRPARRRPVHATGRRGTM